MEKLNLLNSNGIYYIEKSGMKLAFSYIQPFSIFSNDYIAVQLNNKPIIKSEKQGVDRILDSLEDMTGMKLNLPPNMSEMVKSMFSDKNAIKDMMGKFGMDSSKIENMDMDFDLESNEAFDQIISTYNQKAGIKFNAILGLDILNKFIILFEFEDNNVSLFSERIEVGEQIGTSYHITNINKEGYIASSVNLIEINDLKVKTIFDLSGKYIYLNNELYNELIMKQKEIPESKVDTDYLAHLGAINETFFKFNLKGEFIDQKAWIGKLPELSGVLSQGLKDIKGGVESYIPLSFFKKGVLVDGINKKFGYKKP
jgi:hypothetical protein